MNPLLVAKGKLANLGLIPRNRLLCHLKQIKEKTKALQKANATYRDNVVYSFLDDGHREGKFKGEDKNAKQVLKAKYKSTH